MIRLHWIIPAVLTFVIAAAAPADALPYVKFKHGKLICKTKDIARLADRPKKLRKTIKESKRELRRQRGPIARCVKKRLKLLRQLRDAGQTSNNPGAPTPGSTPSPAATPTLTPPPTYPPVEPGTARSLSQYGITWIFSSNAAYGQFVNGDYWVVGPVTLTAISPVPVYSSDHARNGYAVNPQVKGRHGLDSRARDYHAGEAPPPLPLTLNPGDSLLSTISAPEASNCNSGPHEGYLSRYGDCRVGKLQTAAVLTVVSGAQPPDAFRPPYVAGAKPIHLARYLRMDLLPNLALTANAPNIDFVMMYFDRVWIDHKPGWSGQYIHPNDNFANYGREIADQVGDGSLMLLGAIDSAKKHLLAQHFVQRGIDIYGIIEAGGTFPADGGHASGRKFPVVLAGFLLGDPAMSRVGIDYPASSNTFGEDCQTYYDDDPSFPFFHGVLGKPLWGIRHCGDLAGTRPDWHDESVSYRLCCTSKSWTGQILAARLLGLEGLWNHQALFDYVDRYHSEGAPGYGSSAFAQSMWAAYRPQVNLCANGVRDRCIQNCGYSPEQSVDCGGSCPSC